MATKHSLKDLTDATTLALTKNQIKEALQLICAALQNPQAGHEQRLLFVLALERANMFYGYDLLLKKSIEAVLGHQDIGNQMLFPAWSYLLRSLEEFIPLWEGKRHGSMNWDQVRPILQDQFVIEGLKNLNMCNVEVEKVFVLLRRNMLLDFYPKGLLKTKFLPFVCALAQLCFFNEYIYPETDEETKALKDIDLKDPAAIALYGCYRPLSQLDFDKKISAVSSFREMLEVQVFNPQREREISIDIPVGKSITDEVSMNVRDMYEENPYPRWTSVNIGSNALRKIDADADILIAGCGTGRVVLSYAGFLPNCHFTAIDITRASLAYGARMAEVKGCKNVSFYQLDIMDVASLGKKFDFIECGGVLHHMKDPIGGWKSLLSCLKPGGRMLISLYSTIARREIEEIRQYVKSKGYKPVLEDIRNLREMIMNLPAKDPLRSLIKLQDFYSVSQIRDLVFHIQEKTYEIPELEAILADLGLSFDHFGLLDEVRAAYQKRFPDDSSMTNLKNWHELEKDNPHIFITMYKIHCHRKNEEISELAARIV